jgi:hypothetical protein
VAAGGTYGGCAEAGEGDASEESGDKDVGLFLAYPLARARCLITDCDIRLCSAMDNRAHLLHYTIEFRHCLIAFETAIV